MARSAFAWGVVLALAASCGNATVCGPGTVGKFDDKKGETVCVAADGDGGVSTGVQCDPTTAAVMGGVCSGDPSKFPSCGPNTMLDPKTNTCIPTGQNIPTPKPCDNPQPAGAFCVSGVVRFLKDDSYTMGTTLEVRAYDPIAFITNPSSATPLATVSTDSAGTYTINGLKDSSGTGLIALAVTDVGGPKTYVLAGSGASGVAAGGKYTIDLFAIEKSLVADWDTQAGLAGDQTFEAKGAYLGRFIDKPIGMEQSAHPVAGVVLQFNDTPAPDQYYFKGDFEHLDKTLTATDAATGAVVQKVTPSNLGNYSGKGGNITWEEAPGASVPGVVFVQFLHPKAM